VLESSVINLNQRFSGLGTRKNGVATPVFLELPPWF